MSAIDQFVRNPKQWLQSNTLIITPGNMPRLQNFVTPVRRADQLTWAAPANRVALNETDKNWPNNGSYKQFVWLYEQESLADINPLGRHWFSFKKIAERAYHVVIQSGVEEPSEEQYPAIYLPQLGSTVTAVPLSRWGRSKFVFTANLSGCSMFVSANKGKSEYGLHHGNANDLPERHKAEWMRTHAQVAADELRQDLLHEGDARWYFSEGYRLAKSNGEADWWDNLPSRTVVGWLHNQQWHFVLQVGYRGKGNRYHCKVLEFPQWGTRNQSYVDRTEIPQTVESE